MRRTNTGHINIGDELRRIAREEYEACGILDEKELPVRAEADNSVAAEFRGKSGTGKNAAEAFARMRRLSEADLGETIRQEENEKKTGK